MTRPNVLMFMPDQLRADAVGCFGGYARTPHIDALAGRGVRFAQAFSQNSVCSPSRVSMFTTAGPMLPSGATSPATPRFRPSSKSCAPGC